MNKYSKFEDDLDELDDLEEELLKKSTDDDEEDLDEEEDDSEEDKKERKKSKDDDEEEGDLFGAKVIIGFIVVAIIAFIGFRLFSGSDEDDEFTVTFNNEGDITEIIVASGERVTEPMEPTREGFYFAGWMMNNQLFDFNTPITADITLIASWLTEAEARVSRVVIEPNEMTIGLGTTAQLTATVEPSTALDRQVRWESSDTSIITVTPQGLVTAVSAGTATVTVTTNDGQFTATVRVTVSSDVIPTREITVRPTTLSVAVGATGNVTATVLPENATNKAVNWSSSDTRIATVNANGRVTGVREGTATITATTVDGGHRATVQVTVTPPAPVNCQLGWTPWTGPNWPTCEYDGQRQTRTETRTRTIVTPAAHGGTACPNPLPTETREGSRTCTIALPTFTYRSEVAGRFPNGDPASYNIFIYRNNVRLTNITEASSGLITPSGFSVRTTHFEAPHTFTPGSNISTTVRVPLGAPPRGITIRPR